MILKMNSALETRRNNRNKKKPNFVVLSDTKNPKKVIVS